MKRYHCKQLAVIFVPVLVLAGCGSGSDHSAEDLGNRLQAELTPEISDGRASVAQLPDGARVVLTDQALFPSGGAVLDNKGRYILASVVEGLLDPRLLQIEVAESAGTPASLQAARTQAVQTFVQNALVPMSWPYTPRQVVPAAPGSAAPQGISITVAVNDGQPH
jgi:hypothetical protein